MSSAASDPEDLTPEPPRMELSARRLHPYVILSFWKRPSRPAWLSFFLLVRVLLLIAVTTTIVLADAGRSTLSDRVDTYEALPVIDLLEDLGLVVDEELAGVPPATTTTTTTTAASEPGITITISSPGAVALFLLTLLALIGAVVGANLLAWWKIRYGVQDGVFWMTGGVIRPWRRVIPVETIQVVDLSSSILQQLVRVLVVRIESAAPTIGPDVLLTGVRKRDAAAMREVFETRWNAAKSESVEAPEAKMTFRDLLIAGATSLEVGRAIAFVILANTVIRWYSPSASERLTTFDVAVDDSSFLAIIRAFGSFGLLFGGLWLLTTVLFAVNFSRHRLQRRGDLVEESYGRITLRWRMIPPGRVQSLLVTENMLQQLLRLKTLRVAIAGDSRGGSDISILLPTSRAPSLVPVIETILPSHAMRLGVLTGRDLRPGGFDGVLFVIRSTLIRISPLVIGAGIVVNQTSDASPLWALSIVLLATPLIGYRLWQNRDAAWSVEAERLVVRERRIGRITVCAPFDRMDLTTVSQSFMQRRSNEGASFDTATPGSASTWLERKLMFIFAKPPEVHLPIPHLAVEEAGNLQQAVGSRQ